MGEAKKREEAALAGMALLAEESKKNDGKVQLNLHQALVVHAAQRLQSAIAVECNMLTELSHREIAGEFALAMEHIHKTCARYIAQTQQKILVPGLVGATLDIPKDGAH